MKGPILVLILLSVLSACATVPASEPCTGPAVLELRNETAREVEVVESRRGGARVVIGIFGPGQHTVDIRNDANYSVRYSQGGVAAAESAPRYGSGDITMRRVCR